MDWAASRLTKRGRMAAATCEGAAIISQSCLLITRRRGSEIHAG